MAALLTLVALVALAACSPAPPPQPPDATGWHQFHGSWDATGSRRTLQLGVERSASLVDLSGSLLLRGDSRPAAGFRAQVVALGDSATGLIGRAVWTDERDDQVFSELRGEGTATGNRITGTFTGGTGRYKGATGDYELSWQYVLEAEDGQVQGRALGLKGRVRMGPPS